MAVWVEVTWVAAAMAVVMAAKAADGVAVVTAVVMAVAGASEPRTRIGVGLNNLRWSASG